MVFRMMKSWGRKKQLRKAAGSRDVAAFMRAWGDDNLGKKAAKVIAHAGRGFAKDLASMILDRNVDDERRGLVAYALSRAIVLNPQIAGEGEVRVALAKAAADFDYYVSQNARHALQFLVDAEEKMIMRTDVVGHGYKTKKQVLDALTGLMIEDNEPACRLVCKCFFAPETEVRFAAEEIFTERPGNRMLLDVLIESDPLKYETERILEGIRIIGPDTYLPAWEFIFYHLTWPHFFSDTHIELLNKSGEIVAKHKLPIPIAVRWLESIKHDEFCSFIKEDIVRKIVSICEVLVRQYPDKIAVGDIFAQIIERALTVGSVVSGSWPDENAMTKVVPLLKKCSEKVALAGLTSILKTQFNKNILLEEGGGARNIWLTSTILGPDPQKIFRVTIDSVIDIFQFDAEDVLVNLADELGGTIRAEHIDHIRRAVQ